MITPERSPRPTSAPAIAQSHAAEPVPAKPDRKDAVAASKVEKETAKPDARREEVPLEKAKPEPAEASKVCQTRVSLEKAALVLGWSISSRTHPRAAALCTSPPGQQRVYSLPRHGVVWGSGFQGNPSPDPPGAKKEEVQGSWVLVVAVKLNVTY